MADGWSLFAPTGQTASLSHWQSMSSTVDDGWNHWQAPLWGHAASGKYAYDQQPYEYDQQRYEYEPPLVAQETTYRPNAFALKVEGDAAVPVTFTYGQQLSQQRPSPLQPSGYRASPQVDVAEGDDDDDDDSDGEEVPSHLRYPADAPKPPPGAVHPSIGSQWHEPSGVDDAIRCKRCAFFPKGSCKNGYNCEWCHYDHEKRKRKKKKSKHKSSATTDARPSVDEKAKVTFAGHSLDKWQHLEQLDSTHSQDHIPESVRQVSSPSRRRDRTQPPVVDDCGLQRQQAVPVQHLGRLPDLTPQNDYLITLRNQGRQTLSSLGHMASSGLSTKPNAADRGGVRFRTLEELRRDYVSLNEKEQMPSTNVDLWPNQEADIQENAGPSEASCHQNDSVLRSTAREGSSSEDEFQRQADAISSSQSDALKWLSGMPATNSVTSAQVSAACAVSAESFGSSNCQDRATTPSFNDDLAGTSEGWLAPLEGYRLKGSLWLTGDFVAHEAWESELIWDGGDNALCVIKDEMVYVSEVDGSGWAKASSLRASGWLPAAVLRRSVRTASGDFKGGPGYAQIQKGDRIVVLKRDGSWAYGATLADTDRAQVIEEGWFPCSIVATP